MSDIPVPQLVRLVTFDDQGNETVGEEREIWIVRSAPSNLFGAAPGGIRFFFTKIAAEDHIAWVKKKNAIAQQLEQSQQLEQKLLARRKRMQAQAAQQAEELAAQLAAEKADMKEAGMEALTEGIFAVSNQQINPENSTTANAKYFAFYPNPTTGIRTYQKCDAYAD